MEYVLRTFGLCKAYKNKLVLDKVDMNIEKGAVYGFVGENGSGKTTIIRLITGLIHPTAGNFELFGVSSESDEIRTAKKRLGAIVETPSIYLNMSATENLKMQAEILGGITEQKILDTLVEVGLGNLLEDKKKAGDFSLGMRQRLGLAMALLGDPEFIILDEPMNGLDPAGIAQVRELILKLNRERGITFLISSHILTELALVATKYGIISKGKIIKEVTETELKNECRKFTEISVDDREKLIEVLSEFSYEIEPTATGVKVYDNIDLNGVLAKILESQIKILSVNCTEVGIEDYYLSLVGGKGVKNA